MAVFRCWVFVVVLNFVWTFTRADTELSCVFMKRCILPCSFQPGSQVVIHWIQTAGELPVHSYYYNHDQLAHQDQRFSNRTSLFLDQISRGNASLQLTGVQIQDQGRYKCYTSTITGNKEAFINIKVDAPVTKVHMEQVENRIICSSSRIYPEPGLTWSTEPPSNRTFNTTTTVQKTEQLYSISSSVILSHGDADVVHSCTVSTSTNSRRTTLFKPTSIIGSSTETIHCRASERPITSITWMFNHSQVIVEHSSISDEWRPYVKSVMDDGSLTLQHLSSSQNGLYTCELNDAEKSSVTRTFLEFRQQENSKTAIIVGVIVPLLLVSALAFIYFYVKKKKKNKKRKEEETKKTQEERRPINDTEKPREG